MAEQISDDAELRKWIRASIFKTGKITSTVKNEEKDEKKVLKCIMNMKSLFKKLFLIAY